MPQFIRQRMKPASVRGLYSCLTAVFLSLLPASYDTAHRSNSLNISSMLDSVLKHYDKRVRPNYGGPPVEVGITMYILGFSSVSEIDMDFTIDFYFRQFWSDERLMVASPEWDSQLSVGAEVINQIWIPDTFFVNEKKAYFHNATTPNSFLRIASDGAIIRSMRLTVTGACFMNLRYFPMDSQSCRLEIESFGYTALDVVYKWLKKQRPLGISPDVELSQFKLLGHRTEESEIILSTGTYSRLACEFFFVRDMGYYLIQLYIPSGLIVIISWVSFWLNRNASPARVSLGVTTVLTMTTLMSSTNAALPKVSYVKSIDIYLGTCFVLVFAALIEYAAVGYLAKHLAQSRGLQPWQPTDELNIPELFETHQQYYGIFPRESVGTAEQFVQISPRLQLREELPDPLFPNDYTISPSDIDKYSRIAFPVFFICFNLIYWIIYLHISKSNLSDDIVPLAPE